MSVHARPRPPVRRLPGVAVAALAGLLAGAITTVAPAAPADATVVCTFDQVTHHTVGGVSGPSLDADGSRIAFTATGVLDANPNPGNNGELWIYDVPSDTLARLTNESAGSSLQPQINDAGDRIAFTSFSNLGGTNPEGNFEIYRWAETPGTITPVTATAATVGHSIPYQDAAGAQIAYGSNPDGNFEVFLHQVGGIGPDRQVTAADPPALSGGASLDDAGAQLAYASDADGNLDVYVYDVLGAGTSQLTNTATGTSGNPVVADDGTRVTFSSDRNLAGGNADLGFEVFQRNLTTGVTTQLSAGPNIGASISLPRSNAAGTRVVFSDTRNLTGANADGSAEVFVRDTGPAGGLSQLTATSADSNSPSVDESGTRIAFVSSADLVGENADANAEIYLATCPSAPRPDGRVATAAAGPYTGDDVYGTAVAANQTRSAGVARGATRVFFVNVQNDRLTPDTLTVKGVESGSAGYRVAYLQGTTDITARVHAGTFTLTGLASGASVTLKVKITATSGAAPGSARNATITTRSATTPSVKDVVRARGLRT